MLNVIALEGRLVADPELRQTTSGKNVATFRLAVDRGRKDANGQNQADFFTVVAWERLADFAGNWLHRGQLICVDGRLQSRQYQDKNGQNRTAIEVRASNLHFAESKNSQPATGYAAQPAAGGTAMPAGAPVDDFATIDPGDEGDMPF